MLRVVCLDPPLLLWTTSEHKANYQKEMLRKPNPTRWVDWPCHLTLNFGNASDPTRENTYKKRYAVLLLQCATRLTTKMTRFLLLASCVRFVSLASLGFIRTSRRQCSPQIIALTIGVKKKSSVNEYPSRVTSKRRRNI